MLSLLSSGSVWTFAAVTGWLILLSTYIERGFLYNNDTHKCTERNRHMYLHTHTLRLKGAGKPPPVKRMNLKENMANTNAFVCYFHIHMDASVAGIQSSSCSPRCEQMTVPKRKPASSFTPLLQLIRQEGKNLQTITQHLGKSVTKNEPPLSKTNLSMSLIWTWCLTKKRKRKPFFQKQTSYYRSVLSHQ